MLACYKSGDFGKYFRENMNSLGLETPSGLFDTYQDAVTNAALMASALAVLGKGATMAELAAATVTLEKLLVLGAIGATAYIGAAIGSIAVASGRVLGCGSRMSDMFVFTYQNKLQFEGWNNFYLANPQVLDTDHSSRKLFAVRAKHQPLSFELAT